MQTNTMTGDEMDQKIALILGYKKNEDGTWTSPPDSKGTSFTGPPNKIVKTYHRSLDLMQEARKGFTDGEKRAYQGHISKLGVLALDATPLHHAEAFLKTKGEF